MRKNCCKPKVSELEPRGRAALLYQLPSLGHVSLDFGWGSFPHAGASTLMRMQIPRFCDSVGVYPATDSLSAGLHDAAHNVRLWDRPWRTFRRHSGNAVGSAQHPRQLLRTCRRGRFTLKPTTLSTCLDTSKLQIPSQCECGWYSRCKAQLNKNMFSSNHLGILLSPSEIAPRCSLAPSDCARGIAVVWAELLPTTGHKAAQ